MQTEVECNLRKLLKKREERERERERWVDRRRGGENKLNLSCNMVDNAFSHNTFHNSSETK